MHNTSESIEKRLPLLAIVGRPNVGKSALFNRIAGRRIAIVHEQSGVTRDRIISSAVWNDRRIEIADTGGITGIAEAKDEIQSGIEQQAFVALDEASVAIWVVDAVAGIHPLDIAVHERLRKAGIPVVVAANKCDHPERDVDASVFERFGWPVFPVSALHFRGVGDVMDAALKDVPSFAGAAVSEALRIAVVGRPNVGKSSYINRLLKHNRVIVSDEPGTTRDSIDIPFHIGQGEQAVPCVLVDTAGIREKRRIDTAVEYYSLLRSEESIAAADLCILVMDAAQGPTAQDKKIAASIIDHKKGCILVVNKWDRMEGVGSQREYETALRRVVPFLAFAPLVFCSAHNGYNIRRTLDVVEHVAGQVRARIPTGLLNRTLMDAYKKTSPPIVRGKRLKAYYAVQSGITPIFIKLFVNDPERLTASYRLYLINVLRHAFGLDGAPVLLEPVARKHLPLLSKEENSTRHSGSKQHRQTREKRRK